MRSGASRTRPCTCVCGHRGARSKRQLNVVFLSAIICLLSNANNNQTFAFHNGHLHEEDGNDPPNTNNRRRGGAFLKTLSRVAERGASKWGEYVTSTRRSNTSTSSMKKSSSIYISQLHKQIQQMRTKDNDGGGIDEQTIISNDLKKKIKQQMMMEEGAGQQQQPPSEHLIQEMLAYMLGGAAVGSAFAAATAGAFVGTAVVALGAVGTALFADSDDEETVYSLMYDEDEDSNDEDLTTIGADESCDISGESEHRVTPNIDEKKSQLTPKKSLKTKQKMNSFILGELRKCYNGTPYPTVLFSEHRSKDICMVDLSSEDTIDGAERQLIKVKGNCDDDGLNEGSDENESNLKLANAIEEACSSTNDCGDIMPTVEDSTPKRRIEVVFPDAYAGTSNVHYYTEETRSSSYKGQQKRSRSRRVRPRPRERTVRSKEQQTDDEHWATLTDGEREGALLISESLRVASSAFGLVADAVRFTGETAAATAGGAARLAGGAVRVSGWAVSSLGEAIENGGNARDQDDVPTLTSPKENEVNPDRGKTRNRKVAGSSVKLIGDAIEQVADSLLLAGSATERVAFAAAGAAEGTVRIVEDLASSLSDMFSREGRKPIPRVEEEVHEVIDAAEDELTLDEAKEVFLDEKIEDMQNAGVSTNDKGDDAGAMIELLQLFSSWFSDNSDLIVAETAGVPSLAPEMLGVFLMCFLASIFLLSSKEKKVKLPTDKRPAESPQRPEDIAFYGTSQTTRRVHGIEDDDTHSTLTNQSTMRNSPDGMRRHPSASILQRVAHPFIFLLFLPLKLVRVIWVISWKVAFSKKTQLLWIYLLGWTFLSRVSQYKSSVIQRKSELLGYKLAIQSIGKRSSPSRTESAVWLNSIIFKLWKSESGGGLEQLISASASTILASSLEHPYSKPSVVAHVSLGSLTLGSSPPIVTRIEMKGVNDKQRAVYMEVDVGMLLNDANLLLDIKPSSLEYRSLPTTKVSINSLNAKVSLFVAVKCSPNYPYVAFLEMSLADIPEYNVRIEPQNESGLKGIDFGSFPIISKWIKSSINSSLASYLAPKYISIDVLAWLQGDDTRTRL